jgi:hypothetical protein
VKHSHRIENKIYALNRRITSYPSDFRRSQKNDLVPLPKCNFAQTSLNDAPDPATSSMSKMLLYGNELRSRIRCDVDYAFCGG